MIYLVVRHENDYGDLDYWAYETPEAAIAAAKEMADSEIDYAMQVWGPKPQRNELYFAQSECTYLQISVVKVEVCK